MSGESDTFLSPIAESPQCGGTSLVFYKANGRDLTRLQLERCGDQTNGWSWTRPWLPVRSGWPVHGVTRTDRDCWMVRRPEENRHSNEIHNGRWGWDADENDWRGCQIIEVISVWKAEKSAQGNCLVIWLSSRRDLSVMRAVYTHIMLCFVKGLCTDCDCISRPRGAVGIAALLCRWQTAGGGSIPRWSASETQDRTREAFWAKPVLRRFSGPRIGSVGASSFVDFVPCWGKRGAYPLLLEPGGS